MSNRDQVERGLIGRQGYGFADLIFMESADGHRTQVYCDGLQKDVLGGMPGLKVDVLECAGVALLLCRAFKDCADHDHQWGFQHGTLAQSGLTQCRTGVVVEELFQAVGMGAVMV